jgi:hypothetical protein
MYKTPEMFETFRDVKLRVREYYLMAGNLYRWWELYGTVPPSTSWVWSWFPDGDAWHDKVMEYGGGAVDIVTSAYKPER